MIVVKGIDKRDESVLTAVFCCVIVFMLCWLSTRFITLDDLTYRDIFHDFTIHTFVGRYHEWSQRFIIEYLIFTILKIDSYYLPKLIVGLLYVSYFFVLRTIAARFVTVDEKVNLLIALAVFLQSQLELEGAGYLTTHLNYLAPLAGIIFCFYQLMSCMYGIKAIVFFVLFVFCCNNEMVAVLSLLLLPYLYFKAPYGNRPVVITALLIAIAELLLFFFSGATTVRACMHQIWMFPNFGELNILYKGYLGSLTTLLYYFANFNPFTVMFLTTLIAAYLKSCNKELSVIRTAAVALGITAVLYALGYLNRDLNASDIKVVMANYIDFTSVLRISLYVLALLLCGLVFLMIHKLKGEGITRNFKISLYVLLSAAIIVRMILGFSPTILFSQARTFIFSNALILLCTLYIAFKFDLYRLRQFTALTIICVAVCLISRSAFLLSDEAEDYPYYPVLINSWDKVEDYCYLKYDLQDHSILSKEMLEQRKTEYPFEELKNMIETRKTILTNGGVIPAPIFNIKISEGHSSLNRQLEKERKSYNDWLNEQITSGKIILKQKNFNQENADPNALPQGAQPIERLQPIN